VKALLRARGSYLLLLPSFALVILFLIIPPYQASTTLSPSGRRCGMGLEGLK